MIFESNATSDYLERYGLANQKLCYFQIYKILGRKAKNAFENGWLMQILDRKGYLLVHQLFLRLGFVLIKLLFAHLS